MKKEQAKKAIDILNNVTNCLRNQNNGADIHTVGNMRNSASGLKKLLEDDPSCLEEETVTRLVKNLEDRMIEFFKLKYGVQPFYHNKRH